jgi:hypothetical protein
MPERWSLFSTLKRAVATSMRRVHGLKQRDAALVWRGHIEALREYEVLSDDEHAAMAAPLVQPGCGHELLDVRAQCLTTNIAITSWPIPRTRRWPLR